jgi:hypothetical protein
MHQKYQIKSQTLAYAGHHPHLELTSVPAERHKAFDQMKSYPLGATVGRMLWV